ncbi:hypothetical protein [Mesorhizobium sp. BHbdii]
MTKFSEEQVHQHLYQTGLEALIMDNAELDVTPAAPDCDGDEDDFRLWRIIKERAFAKLRWLHWSVRYGEFIGSKVKLPTDSTTPMELDLLGTQTTDFSSWN